VNVMDWWCVDFVWWSKMRYSIVIIFQYTVIRKVIPAMVYYNYIKIFWMEWWFITVLLNVILTVCQEMVYKLAWVKLINHLRNCKHYIETSNTSYHSVQLLLLLLLCTITEMTLQITVYWDEYTTEYGVLLHPATSWHHLSIILTILYYP